MANIVKDLVGDLPEVPMKITVDDESIIRIALAAVIVTTVCILISKLIHKNV